MPACFGSGCIGDDSTARIDSGADRFGRNDSELHEEVKRDDDVSEGSKAGVGVVRARP